MVQWISLVDLEELSLPDTSTDCGCALSVMLLTHTSPHEYSGTFKGGYSARFGASRRLHKEAKGHCVIPKYYIELGVWAVIQWHALMQVIFACCIVHANSGDAASDPLKGACAGPGAQ